MNTILIGITIPLIYLLTYKTSVFFIGGEEKDVYFSLAFYLFSLFVGISISQDKKRYSFFPVLVVFALVGVYSTSIIGWISLIPISQSIAVALLLFLPLIIMGIFIGRYIGGNLKISEEYHILLYTSSAAIVIYTIIANTIGQQYVAFLTIVTLAILSFRTSRATTAIASFLIVIASFFTTIDFGDKMFAGRDLSGNFIIKDNNDTLVLFNDSDAILAKIDNIPLTPHFSTIISNIISQYENKFKKANVLVVGRGGISLALNGSNVEYMDNSSVFKTIVEKIDDNISDKYITGTIEGVHRNTPEKKWNIIVVDGYSNNISSFLKRDSFFRDISASLKPNGFAAFIFPTSVLPLKKEEVYILRKMKKNFEMCERNIIYRDKKNIEGIYVCYNRYPFDREGLSEE